MALAPLEVMLKITISTGKGTARRVLAEGRITRQTGRELAAAVADLPGEGLVLDLSGVTFVDAAGTRALRELARNGATLTGCSGFLAELLREGGGGAVGDPGATDMEDAMMKMNERVLNGDPQGFEELVRRCGPRMLATARRMLRSEEDAEDAVQEAFLSAFKGMDGFAGEAQLSTWLHRIVVNAALMKLRGKRRRPEASIEDLLPRFDDRGEWLEPQSRWSAPGEEILERRESRELVRRAIDRLPLSYRRVLLLRDIEDLDTEEAAAVLGISPNAVKVRLHRARQALRTLLEAELGGGGADADDGDGRRRVKRRAVASPGRRPPGGQTPASKRGGPGLSLGASA
jgi:RNA polymerase sigma-70 factor (ECF subfamily)